ncbi:hypothetical protein PAXRUDRAFT_170195 [Paxillus rubicundulus Ve08.2h10]|uniref:Tc1-like transposase DDE domain-containing protein n=1 Tax=Paxillus rubicundulus Ve08.2h10 TaxID=930991 RepID=A0A0D0CYP1_9AGAM|nr:hypothetical protein PAXRUDRAFT_170195 [Paxillus rubicundulus Ve08.2h10]
MKIEYLPAYLSDFNLIEQAFSFIKSYVHHYYAHFAHSNAMGTDPTDAVEVYEMLFDAVYSIMAEQARKFYHHSGYL